jgi:hypothetical protein
MGSKRFHRRSFLNLRGQHAGAYVIADCRIGRDWNGRPDVDAILTIADCRRVVTLDFSGRTVAEARNAVRKVRILRHVLDDFAVALEAAFAEVERSKRGN